MPVLKLSNACKWCKAVKRDKKLLKRIYKSGHYIKNGEPLKHIARDMDMQYPSLRIHCQRHQGLTEEELDNAKLEQIARATSKQMIARNIRTVDARQSVVDKLHHLVDSDDFDELPSDKKISLLLKALKDTDDVKAKAKDQDIDVMRMMQGYRSGEVGSGKKFVEVVEAELFDPWSGNKLESTQHEQQV